MLDYLNERKVSLAGTKSLNTNKSILCQDMHDYKPVVVYAVLSLVGLVGSCSLYHQEKIFVMTRIFRNVPAISEDFRKFSKDFRTLPKMSEDVPTTFEHFQYEQKHKNFSVL